MSIRLTTTREAAQINGLKVCVYGASGAGKTRLCVTTGEPTVIISAEAGLLSLRDTDIPVIEVATIGDVHDAYRFIAESDDAKDFRWVCLDSVSEIAEVVLSAEKKATKDPRQAYGALQEQMTDLLRAFRDLPGRNVYMSAKLDRQKDELTGGSGRDTFVLGDGRHVFYDDGDALTPGEADLAVLVDFDAGEDRIELTGRAADYRLDFLTPIQGRLDAVLLYDTAAARGDVVAVMRGVSASLSLDDDAFVFV